MKFGIVTLNDGNTVLIQNQEDLLYTIAKYLSEDLSSMLGKHFSQPCFDQDTLMDLYYKSMDLEERAEKLKDKISNFI